jgi:RNA polymerase sigma factor (sigma-70 family)
MTDALVLDNIRLVEYCARQFRQRRDFADLCAHGRLGLVKAAIRYDGSVRFSSFAVPYIRGHVLDYINCLSDQVREPGRRKGAAATLQFISVDAPMHEDSEVGLLETLVDDAVEDPIKALDRAAMPAAIRAEIERMPRLTRWQRKRLLDYLAGKCPLEGLRHILPRVRVKLKASATLAAYWRIARC